jgi:hypothetical protein
MPHQWWGARGTLVEHSFGATQQGSPSRVTVELRDEAGWYDEETARRRA